MRLIVSSEVEPEDLARRIATQLDEDALVDFIRSLDHAAASWTVTERLYDYFQDEMERLAEEKDAEEALG